MPPPINQLSQTIYGQLSSDEVLLMHSSTSADTHN